jgi:hypothetical protein
MDLDTDTEADDKSGGDDPMSRLQAPTLVVSTDGEPALEATAEGSVRVLPKRIGKPLLINRLNYANFQNCSILVHFRHPRFERTEAYRARPLPCSGDRLDCLWVGGPASAESLRAQRFEHFHVIDGQSSLLVRPELVHLDERGIGFRLPEYCEEVSVRRIARYACQGIRARMIQNGMVYHGRLEDFSALSFRLQIEATPQCPFRLINPDATAQVMFVSGPETIFTGECRIIKQGPGSANRSVILEPLYQSIQRFRPKEFRSLRQKLNPAPDIVFRHPLTGKTVMLKALDLAGGGFAVEEEWHRAVLVPGIILPEVEINFVGSLSIQCRAQVIYSRIQNGNGSPANRVTCGLTILDLDVDQHAKLMRLVPQVSDDSSPVSGRVDLDALWNFFFESGFISPYKYAFIQRHKRQIKETYRKLYTENPHIARHFICQDGEMILGHMAMVRFFDNTWLIHHHAARKSSMKRAGLVVLNQISRFSSDACRFPSMHMDYLMCYFRPDNHFPQRVFGGIASFTSDPKECSIDPFAYFHYRQTNYAAEPLPTLWRLGRVHPPDLIELEAFYDHISAGLMLRAIDLQSQASAKSTLSEEYRRLGLQRRIYRVALRRSRALKAIFTVSLSDIGLNLSDLTNCIKVFVIDPEDLTRDILFGALAQITAQIRQSRIPVLIYPLAAAERLAVNWEKIYNLWVMRTESEGQLFFRFLKRHLKFTKG